MSTPRAIIIEAGTGPQHFVLGDLVTLKIHGRGIGGAYSQIETTCGPRVGPPPHIHHREDEANIGDTPGRVLVTMTPAGFEDFFGEVGALTSGQQAELPRLGELAARYGLEFVASA